MNKIKGFGSLGAIYTLNAKLSALEQKRKYKLYVSFKGVETGAIACIGCKTYFFCSLSIEETLKNI